jgi:hypothetical protein
VQRAMRCLVQCVIMCAVCSVVCCVALCRVSSCVLCVALCPALACPALACVSRPTLAHHTPSNKHSFFLRHLDFHCSARRLQFASGGEEGIVARYILRIFGKPELAHDVEPR